MKKLLFVALVLVIGCSKDDPAPLAVADFTFIGDNAFAPATVKFTNTSTNSDKTYKWDFGDGESSTSENPEHTFDEGGIYKVKLTVKNTDGISANITKDVKIKIAQPTADFNFTGANNFAPRRVTFNNNSKNAATYSWSFGDGGSSIEENPSHVFQIGGVYNVTMTVDNGEGEIDVITKTVNILSVPTKMHITSVTITDLNFFEFDGSPWDTGSGPDVYFKVTDDVDEIISAYFPDVAQNQLPLTLNSSNDSTFPISINNVDATLKYQLWEEDNNDAIPNPDDVMISSALKLRDHMPTDGSLYPFRIEFGGTGLTKYYIDITWLE